MIKEIGIGAALGLMAFLAYQGVSLMPIVFMAGLLAVVYFTSPARQMTRRVAVSQPTQLVTVRFEDIGGQEPAKKELLEALDFINGQEAVLRMGIRPLKGILLSGPPGTGKTLLAKASATYTGSVFLAASGSEFIEMYCT